MRLVVVTDIYGRTKCLEELLNSLSTKYESIDIIDPYKNLEIDFPNENEAYIHFQEKVGLNGYTDKLYQHLKVKKYSEYHLLGFSVGASAVWAVSEMHQFNKKTKGICFYSSQIRNLLQVQPKIEIDFYFSKMEPYFNVEEAISVLRTKEKVNCFKTDYLHGFMNQKSKNYNEDGCTKYIEILKNA